MQATYQAADSLTVRDAATREIIATPHVGSRAVMIGDMSGTIRSLRGTALGQWIGYEEERIAEAGGDVAAFLGREVIVADEYRY
jgi:hypothetical protein